MNKRPTKKTALRVNHVAKGKPVTKKPVRVKASLSDAKPPKELQQKVDVWNKDVRNLKLKAEALRKKNPNSPSFKKELAALQQEKNRLEKAKAHIAILAGRRGYVVNNKQ